MSAARTYRDNVCVVIRRRSDGSLLVCHRTGEAPAEGWQFPQGGVDTSLNLLDELRRELMEEIGTDNVVVVRVLPRTYQYDFPEGVTGKRGYRGQRQRWVLAELNDEKSAIRVGNDSNEFDDYQWVTPSDAVKGIVAFKRDVYLAALGDLELL